SGSGVAVVGASPAPTTASGAGGTSAPPPNPAGPTASPAPSSGTSAASATRKVDGPVVDTQYGPIQVEVVLVSGRIQDVVAIQLPTGRRSGQISNYSAPILRQEALSAQSASINTVSGATYTSDAYARSLQAALDLAGHA
ncbi:MAG: hypothetical protein QOG32_1318, partial [Chloroflexota bacterium]|nr:hypothetical protein [Chloroflexota bacterium]